MEKSFNSLGQGVLNDLWKYDFNTNMWTWVSGSNSTGKNGKSAGKGVPDPNNMPGARYSGCLWEADDGALWLFGGFGFTVGTEQGISNFSLFIPL